MIGLVSSPTLVAAGDRSVLPDSGIVFARNPF